MRRLLPRDGFGFAHNRVGGGDDFRNVGVPPVARGAGLQVVAYRAPALGVSEHREHHFRPARGELAPPAALPRLHDDGEALRRAGERERPARFAPAPFVIDAPDALRVGERAVGFV